MEKLILLENRNGVGFPRTSFFPRDLASAHLAGSTQTQSSIQSSQNSQMYPIF